MIVENRTEPLKIMSKIKMLKRLGVLVIEELKKAIDKTDIEHRVEIKKSLSFKIQANLLVISSDHPAFYLESEVRPHRMTYVRNRVIPIALKDLNTRPTRREKRKGVAFRTLGANPSHPGSEPLNLVSTAIKEAQERLVVEMFTTT